LDQGITAPDEGRLWVRDHAGDPYLKVLERFHIHLQPNTYFEVGCDRGASLALAQCASLAVDPQPRLDGVSVIGSKPVFTLCRKTSDAFFAAHDPKTMLGGPIDMAFLDGMHWCEFLLRDFINTERHCRRNSVILLHDCLPVEQPMAERVFTGTSIRGHHSQSWAGDVWRTALLLKRRRPDLQIDSYDSGPTGLVCITNLDPRSTLLSDNYALYVQEMLAENLDTMGIDALFAAMQVESTATIQDRQGISKRYWL
jgi:hypothetical protein